MPGVIGDPRTEGPTIYVDMNGVQTATRGDYLLWSGKSVIAGGTADPAAAYFPLSGIGIALENNPLVDAFGSASSNGKMPVGTHRGGVFRVSAVTGNYSAGQLCFPVMTGSGIVGQTGRTGQAAMWSATAVLPGLLASNFSAAGGGGGTASAYALDRTSAVGQIVRVVAAGATGQWDIILLDPHAANAAMVSR